MTMEANVHIILTQMDFSKNFARFERLTASKFIMLSHALRPEVTLPHGCAFTPLSLGDDTEANPVDWITTQLPPSFCSSYAPTYSTAFWARPSRQHDRKRRAPTRHFTRSDLRTPAVSFTSCAQQQAWRRPPLHSCASCRQRSATRFTAWY